MSNIRTINDVRNPVWANYEKTLINVEVDFDEIDEEYVPFTASPNDTASHGIEIYNNALAGDYGDIADWVPPADFTAEQAMTALRTRRDYLLQETDYIEMPTKWATLTEDEQTAWGVYRVALRDLPADYPNPSLEWNEDYTDKTLTGVTWPEKPA